MLFLSLIPFHNHIEMISSHKTENEKKPETHQMEIVCIQSINGRSGP